MISGLMIHTHTLSYSLSYSHMRLTIVVPRPRQKFSLYILTTGEMEYARFYLSLLFPRLLL